MDARTETIHQAMTGIPLSHIRGPNSPPPATVFKESQKNFDMNGGQDADGSEKMATGWDPETAKELVKETQSYLEDINIKISYKVDAETGSMTVKISNKSTEEVIREFPATHLSEFKNNLTGSRGVIFDTRA